MSSSRCEDDDCRFVRVETRLFGLLWVYYTCVNGVVYDISSWASCKVFSRLWLWSGRLGWLQSNELKYAKADSHNVMYRLMSPSGKEPKANSSEKLLRMMSEHVERASKIMNQS